MQAKSLSGLFLIACGAVLLSAKGVFAKLLYAQGVTVPVVLLLRALMSLPLFWAWAMVTVGPGNIIRADRTALCWAAAAGFMCYYVGAYVDFYALTLIGAGLERILLYTYPAIIVLSLVIWRRQFPERRVLFSLVMTYVGVLLSIGGFNTGLLQSNLHGGLLVLFCALTYTFYFFVNEQVGRQIGSTLFTLFAMSMATFSFCVHFFLVHSLSGISMNTTAWTLLLTMVVFVTVIPILMIAEGVSRIGVQRASLISTVGPPSTILMATVVLKESMHWSQFFGVAIILSGIYVLERKPRRILPVPE
ncbi:MAG: DMT family transporter [Gammaproteobacteria bacterium]